MSAEDRKSPDPASSLRAAALLTLKAKRRKVSSEAPPRPVPTPAPAVQLDYGQQDTASSPPEDGQIREEGEISDSEDAQQKSTAQTKKPPPLDTSSRRSLSVVPKLESPTQNLLEASAGFPDRPVYAVDSNHIRPGLEMNQAQYDTAKDLVLDLLGWGVPPEYLLDCGLSREIIFYVFSELNLRLPENLDTTGLVLYLPTEARSSYPDALKLAEQSSSTSETAPPAGNLHDMERQRRQELLARKAVQASRKAKPDPSSSNQDVEMSSIVPTETVDDFLNSIGSSSRSPNAPSERAMNVDEVPGLQGPRHADSNVPLIVNHLTVSPTSSMFPHHEEPFSIEVAETRRSSESSDDQSSVGYPHRRGFKRPVAADFVDAETDGSHSNGFEARLVRRKMGGSFATVSTMRRCVIDLSDSEGEGDDAVMRDVRIDSEQFGDHSLPTPVSISGTPAPDVVIIKTPPVSYRTSSPAALLEKEKEIMKMRQLIAQREQNSRAKKLTKLSSTATAADASEEARSDQEVFQQLADRDLLEQTDPHPATNGTPQIDDHHTTNGSIDDEQVQGSTSDETTQVLSPVDTQDPQQEASNVDVDLAMSSSAQPITSANPSRHEENLAPLPAKHETFSSYSSLFDSYPLLRSRSRPLTITAEHRSAFLPSPLASSVSSSSITSIGSISVVPSSLSFSTRSRSSSSSSVESHPAETPLSLPDLVPLKLATISKLLDPSKRICQYEVPGGGICRDEGCEDVHLSRIGTGSNGGGLSVEPSDQDTATYLSTALPANWLFSFGSTSQLSLKISDALQQARLDNPFMVFEERVAWALTALEPSLSTPT